MIPFFTIFFCKVSFTFQLVYLEFFLFGYIFYFLFVSEGEFLSDDFNEYTFEDSNDSDKPRYFFGPGGI